MYQSQYCIRTPGDIIMGKKDCFGILEKIFPLTDKGLREIVPECFDCPERISCLKKALNTKEGIEMRAEIMDRAHATGLIGRIRLWSHKKHLSLQAKEDEKKKR
jgi:hypothetical protein